MYKFASKYTPSLLATQTIYNRPFFVAGIFNRTTNTFTETHNSFCRDIMIYDHTYYFMEKARHNRKIYFNLPSPFNQTQFLVVLPSNSIKTVLDGKPIRHAVKLLNRFERKLKWKRTSIHEFPAPKECVDGTNVWLVLGSKCWINNPYFMYIYLAVFKVMLILKNHDKYNTKTLQELFMCAYKEIAHTRTQYEYVSEWLDIIKSRHHLFKGFTAETLYSNDKTIANNQCELYGLGIHACFAYPDSFETVVSKEGVRLSDRLKEWHKNRINKSY